MMLDASSRVVVVGAGIGGLRSAEQLRARGYEGGIVVVGDEEHLPYNRPPLSKAALGQEFDHSKLAFRRRLAADDVHWCLGTTAQAVDVAGGRVTLETGEALLFDALIAATGVTPGASRSWARVLPATSCGPSTTRWDCGRSWPASARGSS